jgi:hypothetical protein
MNEPTLSVKRRRRGIESVQPTTGNIEQIDDDTATGAGPVCDVEPLSASPDASSIETIVDDPLTEKRHNEES